MDEVNVVAGVDDEPGVNVQADYVDSGSPLPDGLDEIVNLLSVRRAAAQRQSRRSAGMPA